MTLDTVLVYRTEEGEYGLKAGARALFLGEDDGTYKDLSITDSLPVNRRVDEAIVDFIVDPSSFSSKINKGFKKAASKTKDGVGFVLSAMAFTKS